MTSNPWGRCPCGHLWLLHDVDEHAGDGSDICCVEGCEQVGCPGTRSTRPVADMLEEMAPDLLRTMDQQAIEGSAA